MARVLRPQRAAILAGLRPAPAGRPRPSERGADRHQFPFQVLMWGTGRWVAYRQTRQAWPFPMQNFKYADPVNEVMVMDPTRPSTNVRLMQDPPLTLLMVMYRRLW